MIVEVNLTEKRGKVYKVAVEQLKGSEGLYLYIDYKGKKYTPKDLRDKLQISTNHDKLWKLKTGVHSLQEINYADLIEYYKGFDLLVTGEYIDKVTKEQQGQEVKIGGRVYKSLLNILRKLNVSKLDYINYYKNHSKGEVLTSKNIQDYLGYLYKQKENNEETIGGKQIQVLKYKGEYYASTGDLLDVEGIPYSKYYKYKKMYWERFKSEHGEEKGLELLMSIIKEN